MKMRFKNLIFALAGALAMTACSNDMEEPLAGGDGNGGQEVKFTVGIENLSRTAIAEGSLKTEFVKGDEIGIFAYNEETAVASNVKYTYDGSVWTSDNAIAAEDGVQLSYYAYYPYSEVTDQTEINVTVNADQSNGFSKDDVLTAQNTTAEAGATSVSLTFAHAMAMVQVSLMQTATDDANATVALQSILPETKVNAKDGSVAAAVGQAVSVAMQKAEGSLTYRAVVPEQTIKAGSKLLTVVAGGKTFNVTFSPDVKYEKGKLLQITVKSLEALPEGDNVTIGGTPIEGWTPGENPGEGDTEEIPLIQKIGTELPEVVTDTKEFTEESWFKLMNNDGKKYAIFEIVDDNLTTWGKAIKLTYDETTAANSWFKGAIGYHHTEPMYVKDTYIYKVTAQIKVDACDESETKSKLSFTCKSKDLETTDRYKWSFAMGASPDVCTATAFGVTPKEAGTWESCTFYIDFSRIASNVSSDASKVTLSETTEKDYNGFDLRVYTNNSGKKPVIYISDVTMEPYQEQ
ncbi:fimbrillin family protein [Phocaeicola plebeius]|uniref:fimbrillin family protein n=1 Tax=Phocaeicola plebeius TaxID=310297 RepID=UPI0026ECBB95|nr:fimbrillin family protein [Phocaeicola plebeius]